MSEMPGEGDREIYGEQSVDDEDQLQPEDTLVDRGVDDILDEGCSPPEHEPAHLRHGMTREEQREGESPDDASPRRSRTSTRTPTVNDYGERRPAAGRLVAPDEGYRRGSREATRSPRTSASTALAPARRRPPCT